MFWYRVPPNFVIKNLVTSCCIYFLANTQSSANFVDTYNSRQTDKQISATKLLTGFTSLTEKVLSNKTRKVEIPPTPHSSPPQLHTR